MADRQKSDLVSYVENQKNQQFTDKPFNSTDGLVLAELGYIHWNDLGIDYPSESTMTLREAISKLDSNYRKSLSEDFQELLTALEQSERFGNMDMSNFFVVKTTKEDVQSLEDLEQFSAVTFTYRDENGNLQNYISYRGTDDTLEGWCEDFNMAYDTMTEAQKRSVWYLNYIAGKLDGNIRVGGHSKGGNDAMYAFLFCDENVRKRIIKIHSYDGPGMTEGICYIDDDGNVVPLDSVVYEQMLKLLKGSAVCPYDSIIGQLLNENDFIFADINQNAGMVAGSKMSLLLDHDAFSWRLDPDTGEFVPRDQSSFSKYLDEVLDEWIMSMPESDRKAFMTAVWGWIYSLGVDDFGGIGDYFKEDIKTAISSAFSYINNLPDDQKKSFVGGLSFLGVCLIDNFLEDKLPGYETIKDKIATELAEREIYTPEDLWKYLKEDPIEHTFDFLQSLISDWETLKAFVEATVTVVIGTIIMKVVIILLKSALTLVIANLPIVAAVLASIVVFVIAINFIREHWDEFVNFLDDCKDYVQEKISEFVEAMRLAINTGANIFITSLVYQATKVVEMYGNMKDVTVDVLQKIGHYTAKNIQNALRISNPLLYCAIRAITGCTQPSVTIDMVRLQNAVDKMDRLATRVGNIDNRLNSLYGKLCINNIEQGEGIFTSLVNMYHLSRADINVDEGNRIRRKANAISSLFNGYKDAERWALSQIGGH